MRTLGPSQSPQLPSTKAIAPLPTQKAGNVEPTSTTTATTTATASTAKTPALSDAELHKVVGQGASTSTASTKPSSLVSVRVGGVERPASRDPIGAHIAQLKADLKVAFATLKTLPPAVTFFGGARIKETDPYYAISKEIGRLLAERGVPPRTGAGPGIMQSVPEGYVAHRTALEKAGAPPVLAQALRNIEGVAAAADLDDQRTQGFNIKLPHEQKQNPVIEVAKEIQLFPFRKLALYENARAVVNFPGGFGTLDELFEVWNLGRAGALSDPIAAVGVAFWQPTLQALERVAVRDRALISPADFARLFVTDSASAVLDHALSTKTASTSTPKAFEQDPDRLEATLLADVDRAGEGMRALKPAVAFLGGERLDSKDPALAVVRALAHTIAREGAAVRVGDAGSGSDAVVDAALAAGADAAHVQQVRWEPSPQTTSTQTTSTQATSTQTTSPQTTSMALQERIPHKELLLRTAEAYVCLPSGLAGLDEMATVLCQMQTGKLPRRPLVLVGSDYWRPILDAWQQTMVSKDRMLIAPEDMELFTVVDDVAAARAALTNLR
jgi:uncharacterized protein (TIGR00730 family)